MASRFEILDKEYIENKIIARSGERTFSYNGQLGQFQQLLKTQVILILNFTRPHAITYTNQYIIELGIQETEFCYLSQVFPSRNKYPS